MNPPRATPAMSLPAFNAQADRARLRGATRKALFLILLGGSTWSRAAAECGVAESTIKRALDRFRVECCPRCGRPWPAPRRRAGAARSRS